MPHPTAMMSIFVSLILAMATTLAIPAHVAAGLPLAGCVPWDIVPVPTDPSQRFTSIDGEAANFWAVGNASTTPHTPTILRWNGATWIRPHVEVIDGWLEDVAVISPDDAWAVGERSDLTGTLVMHWDGSTWAKVPAPSPDDSNDHLFGVSGTSPSDVWAVGVAGYSDGLIMHWDGTMWSLVRHPHYLHYGEEFRGVFALATDDVWAVGDKFSGFQSKPIVQHWDGSAWSNVRLPPGRGVLFGVDGSAPDDVWAVGSNGASLVYRWNGTEWSKLGGILDQWEGEMRGVSALTTDDVWAAGVNQWSQPVIAHWDGSAWSRSPVKKENAWFNTIRAFSQTEIWAGGGGIDGIRAERFRPCS
jgi:hypothetical protein